MSETNTSWGYKSTLTIPDFIAMAALDKSEWNKMKEKAIAGLVHIGSITIWKNGSEAPIETYTARVLAKEYLVLGPEIGLLIEPIDMFLNRKDKAKYQILQQMNSFNSEIYARFLAIGGVDHYHDIDAINEKLAEEFRIYIEKDDLVRGKDKLAYLKDYIIEHNGKFYEYADNNSINAKLINIDAKPRPEILKTSFNNLFSDEYKFIEREVFAENQESIRSSVKESQYETHEDQLLRRFTRSRDGITKELNEDIINSFIKNEANGGRFADINKLAMIAKKVNEYANDLMLAVNSYQDYVDEKNDEFELYECNGNCTSCVDRFSCDNDNESEDDK